MKALSREEAAGLNYHRQRITAREQLEFISAVSAALAEDGSRVEKIVTLADIAFEYEPMERARVIEAVTRKGG